MIHIEDKHKCVGCNGCVSVCPTKCIKLKADSEGFYYPIVDTEKCIDCGLCEKVCPVIHQDDAREPLQTYAAINHNEQIRAKSSSGGIFTILAEKVLADGGVIFGALFNENWEVVHAVAKNSEELAPMRGSKYVQSQIGKCYTEAKKYLQENKKVLFSGTPCQIAGLRRYLQKEYENLICIDFICHGVPSPAVFKTYFNEEAKSLGVSLKDLRNFTFRDKIEGWRNYSVTRSYKGTNNIHNVSEIGYNTLYIKGFLKGLYLRPSCYTCPSKEFKSGSDMTIADFWGIENVIPELDDDKGTSLICINSEKGAILFNQISNQIKYKEIATANALQHNPCAIKSVPEPIGRKQFFEQFGKINVSVIVENLTKTPSKRKTRKIIRKLARWFIGKK